jgi:hypothetical protein
LTTAGAEFNRWRGIGKISNELSRKGYAMESHVPNGNKGANQCFGDGEGTRRLRKAGWARGKSQCRFSLSVNR